ncbi:MAG TPA: SAM-dependent methyltransferase [Marinilabiliales bacterium]|jgi:tRNA U34 5-methylaminomethyl-2-thiouridine-forming methyltransferase MnmC|nr:SAM-dependent methyltransferase [Marinilabiliales bacterium]
MENQQPTRQIILTSDGSHTLFVPLLGEHYHSIHGAIQESRHVFIQTGLGPLNAPKCIKILEIGFGTGLNALLAMQFAHQHQIEILFTTIEKYPLRKDEFSQLNYGSVLGEEWIPYFQQLHECPWEQLVPISEAFSIQKIRADLLTASFIETYQIVFFDAFGPDKQPDLWTVTVFEKLYKSLEKQGVLVTYSAKGQVRRNLKAAGFEVERLPGPPGKREMLRATKKA